MQKKIALVILIISLCVMTGAANAQEQQEGPLTLEQSIALALERSPLFHSAQAEVTRTNFLQKGARSDFFPKLTTGYNFTQLNEPPHSNVPAFGSVPAHRVITGPLHTYVWDVTVEQPLFTGWSITTNHQLAKLGFDIAKVQEIQAKLDLVNQVKVDYFSLLKAEKILGVAIQTEKQIGEHYKVAESFFEVGIIPKNDLLQSEVQLAQAKQYLIHADNGVNIAKSTFNTILRRDVNEPLEVVDILTYTPSTEVLDDCIHKAYLNRPELKEMALKVEEARKQITLAKSPFYPSLSLQLYYAKQGDTPNVRGTRFQDEESWNIFTSLNWTLWEWGKTYYSVNATKIGLIQAEDARTQIRDGVTLEVKNAFLKLQESEKNIKVTETAIDSAEENFRLNESRYKEQVATTTDVMDAQTLLTQAQINYYNALSDYNIARAQLERAMGVEK
ncbi:MAG TPA: TolC family protein [Thermodesulfobacteriota bacterium]|nr:TolC family protein [Thermodesulfobacteriota bacterium]